MSVPNIRAAKTVDDLIALGDEARVELIDGELIPKAMANVDHGSIQSRLGVFTGPYTRRKRKVIGKPEEGERPEGWFIGSEISIKFSDDTVLLSDVAGWRQERIMDTPKGPVMPVLPDWVCEILSPSNWRQDVFRKKKIYLQYKVNYYWIVDPEERVLTVVKRGGGGYSEERLLGDGIVYLPPFERLPLRMEYLWGDVDYEGNP